jgi:hypothetical protein
MIVEELEFKRVMDFLKADLEWISDVVKGPDNFYSVAAKNAARKAQDDLMRLMAQSTLLKRYIDSRNAAFAEVCRNVGKVDEGQLNLFGTEV